MIKKTSIILILITIAILACVSGVSAQNIGMSNGTLSIYSDDNSDIVSISASNLEVVKNKNDSFKVLNKQKVTYKILEKYQGKPITINKIKWSWGDGTSSNSKTATHTYKTSGWKKIKIVVNASADYDVLGWGNNKTRWIAVSKTFNVYVDNKADLVVSSIVQNNNQKNGNVHSITIKLSNQGASTMKKSYFTFNLKYGKYSKTVKGWIPAIKSGKKLTFTLKMPKVIPYNLRNKAIRTIKLNTKNAPEAMTFNNIIQFKG
ncbi:PKD domain-containing protein [Methanobrevibacter curvatus]|uniref:PKD domain-containing protein n=1 Tax=Methanobrevibacter curvatus TaxID=49547 RepID=A0A166CUG0_9EURY|nr:PKD domain-containing protein [Methanobrevibacter curvatus]KZX14875.1 hypothetical protein MBCUR_03640 [Methanobrevibacter curvatus]